MMKTNYQNLVLKPQREGGGNNIFNDEIKYFIIFIPLNVYKC
jgi:hypothetical protein